MFNKGENRKSATFLAFLWLSSACLSTAAMAASTGQTYGDEQAAALANQIVVTARQLPMGSTENTYEAQFASLFDQAGANCTRIRLAADQANGLPRNAYIALRRLASTLTTCGAGTAAIGGGRANSTGVPGFAVGGGSDYVR